MRFILIDTSDGYRPRAVDADVLQASSQGLELLDSFDR
jgi:hypothetical protein